jgi:hypothetical protein
MSVTSDNISVTHPSSSGGRVLQAKFIRPAQMSLFARVTCYPPLGEVTCVKRSQQLGSVAEDKVCLALPYTNRRQLNNVATLIDPIHCHPFL